MIKPKTKAELLALAESERKILEDVLLSLSEGAWTDPTVTDAGWEVKDVLSHLTAWQSMFFDWYAAGLRGEVPPLPALGYKWNQTPALNQMIFERYKDRSVQELRDAFESSHARLLALIGEIPEDNLTAPGRYAWTKNWTLLQYTDAVAGRHYHWASDMIRKWAKKRRG